MVSSLGCSFFFLLSLFFGGGGVVLIDVTDSSPSAQVNAQGDLIDVEAISTRNAYNRMIIL